MASGKIVRLDIGGTVFKTTKSTLTRFDGMLKVMMETEIPVEKDESGCIFIDRDPTHFRLILNFLRDGHVALPDSEKEILEIQQEAQFYQLNGLMELCQIQLEPDIIKLNVGGTVFQTKKCMLKRFPSCFKFEKDEAGCIFIDRNPKHFPLILDFLRYGAVELPDDKKEIREILKEAISYQVDGLVKLSNERSISILAPSVRFLECDDDYIRLITNPKKPVLIIFYRFSSWRKAFKSEAVENFVKNCNEKCDVYFKSLGTADGTTWKFNVYGFGDAYSTKCQPDDIASCVHRFFVERSSHLNLCNVLRSYGGLPPL